ncbi:Protein of unknown function [Pyronema omphalodes CBS 100304]|uniref:Uncharacterized protein n=1 Tax=Pyronema omphalodes (strain CBS 100304) TaxID=1076935 RepID=U4L0E5_PYROM|nr:Protein of unknown function [Pyronema omphalodes CBS 100304]
MKPTLLERPYKDQKPLTNLIEDGLLTSNLSLHYMIRLLQLATSQSHSSPSLPHSLKHEDSVLRNPKPIKS